MVRPSEFDLITEYFTPLAADHPGSLGLGDDAAVFDLPAGMEQVVTTDALVAGVHFFSDDPPRSIAIKALGVNLSDLAAMGAAPLAYTLAVAWPADISSEWIADFVAGLAWMQAEHNVHLVGGDTVATPGPLMFSVTAFGTVKQGRAIRRGNASPGDLLFVSGTIGDSALGLRLLSDQVSSPLPAEARDYLIDRYRNPQPRTGLGPALVGLANSAIDISDGLIADAGHLAARSGHRIAIELDRVPLSPAARALIGEDSDLMAAACSGGDDYELAFTVPMAEVERVTDLANRSGIQLSEVGRVEAAGSRSPGVDLLDGDGNAVDVAHDGFQHF